MSLQIDGNTSLIQQETQLQAIETFFVEVIDYEAGDDTRNNVTTKPITGAICHRLQLKALEAPADLAEIAGRAVSIVFDRLVFIAGQQRRVVGFRV